MRRCLTYVSTFAGLCFASMAWGQVGGPLLGYLPDGGQIRPVDGIPAAAAIGPALDLKQDFARIVASPSHDYVLVVLYKLGTVAIYTPALGLTPLKGAGTAPDLVVTSPRGSAALLWFSRSQSGQVVTGLPDAPVIRHINAGFLRTAPSSLTITDDGNWAAGVWSTGIWPGVFMWGSHGQEVRLPLSEHVDALAFFPGRADLAVAISGQVLMFQESSYYTVGTALYNSGDWQPDVAALAVSPDNASVILADRTGVIVSIDTTSGNAVKVDCSCQPEGLFGMGQSAFRLTGLANSAFLVFDAVHKEVLFVPLALSEGATP